MNHFFIFHYNYPHWRQYHHHSTHDTGLVSWNHHWEQGWCSIKRHGMDGRYSHESAVDEFNGNDLIFSSSSSSYPMASTSSIQSTIIGTFYEQDFAKKNLSSSMALEFSDFIRLALNLTGHTNICFAIIWLFCVKYIMLNSSTVDQIHNYSQVATVNQSSPFPLSSCHSSTQLDSFSFSSLPFFSLIMFSTGSHGAEALFFAK